MHLDFEMGWTIIQELVFFKNSVNITETRPDTLPGISRGGWAGAV